MTKKTKVKLSESKGKLGKTNWAALKKDNIEANKKIQPTQKPLG